MALVNFGRKAPRVEHRPHVRLQGTFAPGTALTNGTSIKQILTVANCVGFAVRILSAATGNLSIAYLDPGARVDAGGILTDLAANAAYATGNPAAAVAVSAATEAILQVSSIPVWNGTLVLPAGYNGESFVLLTFAPTSSAALTWCDFCQITRLV